MPRVERQRFRDETGARKRSRNLQDDPRGTWSEGRPLHPASTNPALEAGMAPFLADLTIPQRDSLRAAFWAKQTNREAAQELGIDESTHRERLAGAKAKLKAALAEAAGSESFAEIRQWLTPSAKITKSGIEDKWITAACVNCGEILGQYRANALGFLPALNCGKH